MFWLGRFWCVFDTFCRIGKASLTAYPLLMKDQEPIPTDVDFRYTWASTIYPIHLAGFVKITRSTWFGTYLAPHVLYSLSPTMWENMLFVVNPL